MGRGSLVFVHWVLPLAVIAAACAAYGYARWLEGDTDRFASDPRLAAALACTVDDMWVHHEESERVAAMGDLLDEDDEPPAGLVDAAEAGDRDAMYTLAIAFLSGMGDDDIGMAWLRRAADAGQPAAQFELGSAYIYGYQGTSPDRQTGLDWWQRAASGGEAYAQYSLARLTWNSLDSARRRAAPEHMLDAAGQCFPSAMRYLARNSGARIPVSPEQARWLENRVAQYDNRGGNLMA